MTLVVFCSDGVKEDEQLCLLSLATAGAKLEREMHALLCAALCLLGCIQSQYFSWNKCIPPPCLDFLNPPPPFYNMKDQYLTQLYFFVVHQPSWFVCVIAVSFEEYFYSTYFCLFHDKRFVNDDLKAPLIDCLALPAPAVSFF